MSTPQTSGIGEPIRGTVSRTGPKSSAGQGFGPVRKRRPDPWHQRHVVEIECPRHVREQIADRLGGDGRDGLHHFIVEYSRDERAC